MLATALWLCMSHAALALEPAWPPGPYNYVVIEQDLKEVLTEFGRNTNIPIKISDEVKGRVRGRLAAGTAEQFIKRLAETNSLIWYFDGSTLYISAATELRTEVFDLGKLASADIDDKLSKLGIADARFPIRTTPGANVASVSGPPPYLALVRQTLIAMTKQVAPAGEDTRVYVFRGTAS